MSNYTMNKTPILSALASIHANRVEVEYSGSGDSGQVDGVAVVDASGTPISIHDVSVTIQQSYHAYNAGRWEPTTVLATVPLADALKDFVYDWLEASHPGWEMDDGSHGTLFINLASQEITFSHSTHYSESFTEEYTL